MGPLPLIVTTPYSNKCYFRNNKIRFNFFCSATPPQFLITNWLQLLAKIETLV